MISQGRCPNSSRGLILSMNDVIFDLDYGLGSDVREGWRRQTKTSPAMKETKLDLCIFVLLYCVFFLFGNYCVHFDYPTSHSQWNLSTSCHVQHLTEETRVPSLPKVSKSRYRIETSWGAQIVWADTEVNVLARQPKGVYNVGLNIVAIAKYIKFLQSLIITADKYFMRDHNVTYFVISDKLDEVAKVKTNRHIVSIMEKSQDWPNNTLVRFQYINKHRDVYHNMNFFFQIDVDMLFVSSFNSEALGSRVGTLHPGYYWKQRLSFPYDRNPKSTAYVNRYEGEYYFVGGVFGGCVSEVISMADIIVKNILTDLNKYNYIALWHDESHLNRYFIDHPPTKVLSPEYSTPEDWIISTKRRLLALNKNHKAIRS